SFCQPPRRFPDPPSFPTRRSSDLGLEKDRAEAIVGKLLAVDTLAAEMLVPYLLAAGPQVVAVLVDQALPELRALDEVAERFALRSEEHTSELQSRENLVCRLLLEK